MRWQLVALSFTVLLVLTGCRKPGPPEACQTSADCVVVRLCCTGCEAVNAARKADFEESLRCGSKKCMPRDPAREAACAWVPTCVDGRCKLVAGP